MTRDYASFVEAQEKTLREEISRLISEREIALVENEKLRSENKDLRMDRDIALADAREQSDIADEYLTQLFDARAEIDILRNDVANLKGDMDDMSAEIANRSIEVFSLRAERDEALRALAWHKKFLSDGALDEIVALMDTRPTLIDADGDVWRPVTATPLYRLEREDSAYWNSDRALIEEHFGPVKDGLS